MQLSKAAPASRVGRYVISSLPCVFINSQSFSTVCKTIICSLPTESKQPPLPNHLVNGFCSVYPTNTAQVKKHDQKLHFATRDLIYTLHQLANRTNVKHLSSTRLGNIYANYIGTTHESSLNYMIQDHTRSFRIFQIFHQHTVLCVPRSFLQALQICEKTIIIW